MKHTGILLTLVAALLFVACRTDNTSIQLLNQAEAMMNAAPDTALALLDSIDSHRLGRADNARYALLRSQALDKNFIDITNDSLISIAVDYYAHSHNEPYKMLAHYYYGRILFNAGDYAHSIIELLKAEKVAISLDDMYRLGLIYSDISNIYDNIYWGEGAIEYAQKSFEAYSKTNLDIHLMYSLLNLGIKFFNYYDYDASEEIFNTLLSKALAQNDSTMCVEALTMLASTHWAQKDYDKTIDTYEKAIEYDSERNIISAPHYSRLSCAYTLTGMPDDALKSAHIASQKDTSEVWGLYLYNEKYGNPKEALHYLNIVVSQQNEILDNITTQSILKSVENYNLMEEKLYKQTHLYERALLIIIIITIIIAAIIRIKIVNADIEKSIALTHNLKNTLFVKDKYIEALQSDVNELFSGQFEMLNKLCAIYYEGNDEKKNIYTTYNSIKSTIKNISSDKQTISQLEMLANKHLNNIMTNFRSNYPNLSNDDNQLFLYLVMGFSPQAISIILNIDIKKVYNRKSSLKRKVCNVTDKDITQFAPFFGK